MPRVPLNMPKMSMTMEFGTIVEWLVGPGDKISNGDAVVVVTTDKVDMEVEATFDGVMEEIVAGEGAQLPVGEPMAYLQTETADLLGDLFAAPPQAEANREPASAEPAPRQVEPATPTSDVSPHVTSVEPIRAVPLARRIAAEAGVDLRTVTGTGPSRTIRARDVREAITRRDRAAKAAPAPARVTPAAAATPAVPAAPVPTQTGELLGDDKIRRMRVATANVMNASAMIPQFTVFRALDLARLARARETSLKGVSWTSILVRAYALVLREMPQLNGYWVGTGVQGNERVGISLAVDTPQGLLAPP